MLKFLLRNIRFLASFRCLEFTHYFKFLLLIFLVQLAKWQEFQNNFFSSVSYHIHMTGDFTLGGLILLDYLIGDFTLGGLIQLD